MCNWQLLPINQNQALFSLLGTTYGGNGQTNFALPDLRGKAAMSMGSGYTLGEVVGEYQHTITIGELPAHTHFAMASNSTQNSNDPTGHYLANTQGGLTIYGGATSLTPMFQGNTTFIGGGQAHNNQSPYLVMNWIIALQGIFPSQN